MVRFGMMAHNISAARTQVTLRAELTKQKDIFDLLVKAMTVFMNDDRVQAAAVLALNRLLKNRNDPGSLERKCQAMEAGVMAAVCTACNNNVGHSLIQKEGGAALIFLAHDVVSFRDLQLVHEYNWKIIADPANGAVEVLLRIMRDEPLFSKTIGLVHLAHECEWQI